MNENMDHKFLEGDQLPDVEGHVSARFTDDGEDAADDVEGHLRRPQIIDEEEDDVEGHVMGHVKGPGRPPRDLDIERV